MRTTYTSGKELKEKNPLAWRALMDDWEASAEEEKEFLNDISHLVDTIREGYLDSKETTDSCYIYETYITDERSGFKFEVYGSSYRKDQCICDQEMSDEITVIDVEAEKKAKIKEKNNKEEKNYIDWKGFIDNATPDQLLEKLKTVKFK